MKEIIRRKIKCAETLDLVDLIIDGSNPQDGTGDYFAGDDLFTPHTRRKGLPLGNLTSQYFANLYLSSLDHFVKETLGVKAYIRYVDDFILFHGCKHRLNECRRRIEEFLEGFRLRIHANRAQVQRCAAGITFCGYRIFPDRIRLKRVNVIRARRRMRRLARAFRESRIPLTRYKASVCAWLGHAKTADSWRVRRSVLA
jgi:hypothetical protein